MLQRVVSVLPGRQERGGIAISVVLLLLPIAIQDLMLSLFLQVQEPVLQALIGSFMDRVRKLFFFPLSISPSNQSLQSTPIITPPPFSLPFSHRQPSLTPYKLPFAKNPHPIRIHHILICQHFKPQSLINSYPHPLAHHQQHPPALSHSLSHSITIEVMLIWVG